MDLEALGIEFRDFDFPMVRPTAEVWTPGTGLSLEDRACLPLTQRERPPPRGPEWPTCIYTLISVRTGANDTRRRPWTIARPATHATRLATMLIASTKTAKV